MTYARFIAPASYVQGPDVLGTPETFEPLAADRAFVLGGETALGTVKDPLVDGLERASIEVATVEPGVDTCTYDRIEALSERVAGTDSDLVVGVGGGVALDTAKAVAERADAALAIVATIASTDAPCSSVAVVYDADGGFAGYVHRRRNPDLVVVDTAVVANAPERFLRHGLGDAFATRFEAETVARTRSRTHAGGVPTDAALTLARRSFDNIAADGPAALEAVRADAVTPAVERIVETNTLLSGVGFESGGLAAAHAFSKGFSRAGVTAPHGRLVAFSTFAHLVMEDRGAGILEEALSVARSVGLDDGLEALDAGTVDLDRVAREACRDDTTMSNMGFDVTPSAAADALRAADALLSRT